jgi:hypothetical protein
MKILLSWICYRIGDAINRTVEPVFGHWFSWPYRTYNWLMLRSADLQGDDPRGPWSDAQS